EMVKRVFFFLTGILIAMGLSGCKGSNLSPEPEANNEAGEVSNAGEEARDKGEPESAEDFITNDNLLFDYFEKIVAIEGESEYREFCLYKFSDEELILAMYNKKQGAKETMDYCFVPFDVLDECMDITDRHKMREWNNGVSIDGMIYVVKFRDGEVLKRVSSENMPKDGMEAFDAVADVLFAEWNSASRDME
nr:hypothetical protein [Lachnospiraceae bacterium]